MPLFYINVSLKIVDKLHTKKVENKRVIQKYINGFKQENGKVTQHDNDMIVLTFIVRVSKY